MKSEIITLYAITVVSPDDGHRYNYHTQDRFYYLCEHSAINVMNTIEPKFEPSYVKFNGLVLKEDNGNKYYYKIYLPDGQSIDATRELRAISVHDSREAILAKLTQQERNILGIS